MEPLTKLSARSLQYYIIAQRWLADLEFLKVEMKFFQTLITEIGNQPGDRRSPLQFQDSVIKLVEMEPECMKAESSVAEHLKKLEMIAENRFPETMDVLAAEQACLEYLVLDLIHAFRTLKTGIFKTVQLSSKFDQRNAAL